MIICIFYHVNNLFLPQSALFKKHTPSQINLIKNAKNRFLLLPKIKAYRKCPALLILSFKDIQSASAKPDCI